MCKDSAPRACGAPDAPPEALKLQMGENTHVCQRMLIVDAVQRREQKTLMETHLSMKTWS
eukprot:scaffold301170_cov14-Tisochrysis_lutea.AAC.1